VKRRKRGWGEMGSKGVEERSEQGVGDNKAGGKVERGGGGVDG